MEVVLIILKILLALCCIGVVGIVLLQDSNSDGLSGVIGGGNSDSFFGKNKGKSTQAKLAKLTVILSIVFAVLVLVVDLIVSLVA